MIRNKHQIRHGHKLPLCKTHRSNEEWCVFFMNEKGRCSLLINLTLYADIER